MRNWRFGIVDFRWEEEAFPPKQEDLVSNQLQEDEEVLEHLGKSVYVL